jgi:hypothetical protein
LGQVSRFLEVGVRVFREAWNASGELWRSRFDATRNVIVVNNGHRDFVFASHSQALKLGYLLSLYVKEFLLSGIAVYDSSTDRNRPN